MTLRFAPCLVALALLGACVETAPACSQPGYVRRDSDGACVPEGALDAGPHDAGPSDTGMPSDGGPCDPACTGGEVCADLGGTFECVECAGDGDCGARHCDLATHTCVDCTEHAHCDGATPLCESGACTRCDEAASASCADRDSAAPVCDDSTGSCVQCTAGNESACGTAVCDVRAGSCSGFAEHSAAACGECVNDRQCQDGQLCVPDFVGGGTTELGYVCAWRQDFVSGGDCLNVRPHILTRSRTSVNGVTEDVCTLAVSSCAAHRDFRIETCMSGTTLSTPVADAACGADAADDGFCSQYTAAGTNRCTAGCSSLDDCPCSDGTCTRQYRCASGFCSLTSTCLVASPGTCT